MGEMTRGGRPRTLALAASMTIMAAGCTGGSGSGAKAGGGGAPVALKMASLQGSLDFTPQVADFVKRVGQLSGGALRIDVVANWTTDPSGDVPPDAQERIVRDVAAGK